VAGARLENLNPQQRRAVEHGGSVLAEAGARAGVHTAQALVLAGPGQR